MLFLAKDTYSHHITFSAEESNYLQARFLYLSINKITKPGYEFKCDTFNLHSRELLRYDQKATKEDKQHMYHNYQRCIDGILKLPLKWYSEIVDAITYITSITVPSGYTTLADPIHSNIYINRAIHEAYELVQSIKANLESYMKLIHVIISRGETPETLNALDSLMDEFNSSKLSLMKYRLVFNYALNAYGIFNFNVGDHTLPGYTVMLFSSINKICNLLNQYSIDSSPPATTYRVSDYIFDDRKSILDLISSCISINDIILDEVPKDTSSLTRDPLEDGSFTYIPDDANVDTFVNTDSW